MTWFSIALLAGLLFSVSRTFSRFALRKAGDYFVYTIIHDFIAGLIILPLIFIGLHWPTQSITWLYFILTMVSLYLTDVFTFKALQFGDVSTYQIVTQVRNVFILFFGLIIFGEQITIYKLLAVLLIIIGATIALREKSKIHFNKAVYYTIIASFFVAVGLTISKLTLRDFSPFAFASLSLMGGSLLGLMSIKFDSKKIIRELAVNKWLLILTGGIFGFYEFCQFLATKLGEVSRVTPVLQSSLVFTVLMGIFLLGEKQHFWQKILGTIIIIGGILMLNYL
ncbi:MAG: hypothetical protein ACD_58C00305G0010 [uncultured bacterium]|nr:MAG: hypothetical protein ACD_58C00305G0010 [uncultured bacterium]